VRRVLAIVVPGAMIVGLAFSPTTGVVLAAPVPGTTCPVFPDDNAWHLNVSALPVHPKNAAWKRATHATRTMLHPDFGPPAYGLPFDVVTSSHATTRVRFRYDDESDDVRYPFDAATPIERGSDRHAVMIDRDACVLYELFDARWNDGRPTAGSGAMFRMDGAHANDLRPQGGRAPTRPACRSSPDWCGATRSTRGRSTTRCGSRCRARATRTSGRRDTRPRRVADRAHRWARGSGSAVEPISPGSPAMRR
jgi:hypothetical protein